MSPSDGAWSIMAARRLDAGTGRLRRAAGPLNLLISIAPVDRVDADRQP
jgi:hypothetical protein